MKFLSAFTEFDASPQHYREWAANIQTAHGQVFAYVEGLIVLGALQYAVSTTNAWGVWVIYGIAFLAQITLTSVYIRVLLLLQISRLKVSQDWKKRILVVAFMVGVAINIAMINVLDSVIDQIVTSGVTGQQTAELTKTS